MKNLFGKSRTANRPIRKSYILRSEAENLLDHPPVNGVHSWIMKVAWACHKAGLGAQETADAILASESRLRPGREFAPGEIEDAVGKVFGSPVEMAARKRQQEFPEYDAGKAQLIFHGNPATIADLMAKSPVAVNGLEAYPVLRELFPGGSLICMGLTAWKFITAPLEAFHGNARHMQIMVPACMTAMRGLTQAGKMSAHTLSNTGVRRFLIVEFDYPPLEWQPSLAIHLAGHGPLVMVVFSGNKSLHLWFNAIGVEDHAMLGFFKTACRLGADPAHWRNRSQFVRTPGAKRDNGIVQQILYFDPSKL